MLSRAEFKGYRGFAQYELGSLARVNLLVGRNNCGKTALLEGLHFLLLGGVPSALGDVLWRRGEFAGRDPGAKHSLPDPHHLFHRAETGPADALELSGDWDDGRQRSILAKPAALAELQAAASRRPAAGKAPRIHSPVAGATRCLYITLTENRGGYADETKDVSYVLSDQEPPFFISATDSGPDSMQLHAAQEAPTRLITPESLRPDEMARLWSIVLQEGREDDVVRAMQIIEPDISSIVFLPSAGSPGGGDTGSGILVGHAANGSRSRVPLGSYGDGLRRLLALSLSHVCTRGGTLLVDELDSGLHYSVMADMWRMVIRTAVESGMQVFATTHSNDCLRGLADACRGVPELEAEVALHKIEPRLEKAVSVGGKDIVAAVDLEVEMR